MLIRVCYTTVFNIKDGLMKSLQLYDPDNRIAVISNPFKDSNGTLFRENSHLEKNPSSAGLEPDYRLSRPAPNLLIFQVRSPFLA